MYLPIHIHGPFFLLGYLSLIYCRSLYINRDINFSDIHANIFFPVFYLPFMEMGCFALSSDSLRNEFDFGINLVTTPAPSWLSPACLIITNKYAAAAAAIRPVL